MADSVMADESFGVKLCCGPSANTAVAVEAAAVEMDSCWGGREAASEPDTLAAAEPCSWPSPHTAGGITAAAVEMGGCRKDDVAAGVDANTCRGEDEAASDTLAAAEPCSWPSPNTAGGIKAAAVEMGGCRKDDVAGGIKAAAVDMAACPTCVCGVCHEGW